MLFRSVSILGDKISLFEKNPVNVAYENNEEYKLNNAQIKLGDWFLVGGIVQGKHFLSNIYLTNDFVYFVPINIPEEATEAFNENQVNVLGEVYEYDDKIILKIKDTGHGIKQGDLDKIFDRFYTIDKSHNEHSTGFGLGLAIVKKIINQSGWKISVESEYEKYTMFTVEFSPIMK